MQLVCRGCCPVDQAGVILVYKVKELDLHAGGRVGGRQC